MFESRVMLGPMGIQVMMRLAADRETGDDEAFLDALEAVPVSMWSLGQCARYALDQVMAMPSSRSMGLDEARRRTLAATNEQIDRRNQALANAGGAEGLFGHLEHLLPYQEAVLRRRVL